jgi:hypothetical protein
MNEYDNKLLNRHIYGGSLDPVIVANMITYERVIDCLVNAFVTIDYEHHEIHEGALYMVDHVDLALAAAATMSLCATIPADIFTHFRFVTNAGGACHVELKEGAGFAGGAAEVIYNANRNGPAAPFNALSDPVIAGGVTILEYTVAAGAGPRAGGGKGGLFEEIVTQDDETYSIELTNHTNGAILASIVVSFYTKTVAICP